MKENNYTLVSLCENKKDTIKKVKCYTCFSEELNRELAVHADCEDKNKVSVTDVLTGLRLFGIDKPLNSIELPLIYTELEKFIKHYTLESIHKELQERPLITEVQNNDNKQ